MSSSAARTGTAERGLVTDAIVVVGIAASLGLIVVSVIINFRLGYRSADTPFDAWVYGLAAGTADALKATAPFAAAWGWRNRDGLAVVTACMLFAVFSCYSLWAEIGFAAEHRAMRQAKSVGTIEQRADLRRDYERIQARLAHLGNQRSEGEIGKAIAAALSRSVGEKGRTVGQVSSRCAVDRKDSRAACSAVAFLLQEAERSREHVRLIGDAAALRARLDVVRVVKGSGDAQLDTLETLTKHTWLKPSRTTLEAILSTLVALLIELGSGLGVYIATTPWRGRARGRRVSRNTVGTAGKSGKTAAKGENAEVKVPMAAAAIEAYMLERVEPRRGYHLTADEAYVDYQRWCAKSLRVELSRETFTQEFAELARLARIQFSGVAGRGVYRDIAIGN